MRHFWFIMSTWRARATKPSSLPEVAFVCVCEQAYWGANTMRLDVKVASSGSEKELVSAVGWSPTNELFSCSDDKSVHKWNSQGQAEGQVK